MKNITSRFPARCRDCKGPIAAGESIWWERGFGSVCDACFTKPAPASREDVCQHGVVIYKAGDCELCDPRPARATADHGIEEWEMVPTPVEPLAELGPDALLAEISTLSDWYSDSFDGTPDEIFHRSEADGRRYDRIKRALEALGEELARRTRDGNGGDLEALGRAADREYERMAEGL